MVLCTDIDTYSFSAFGLVVVGRRMIPLTDRVRWAIVLHEQGHIALSHGWKRIGYLLTFRWLFGLGWLSAKCRQQELEADLWAARHGYGPELLAFLSRLNAPESIWHPSTEERCKALKEYLNG